MDFYRIFLDYFKKCVQEQVQINIDEMLEMAKGNETSANSALQELINNGFVTFKLKMNVFQPGTRLENFENIALTEKGYKELLNQIESKQLTEIAKFKALTPDSELDSSKIEQRIEHRQQIIKENDELKKELKDDVKKLSTEDKYHLIKKEILVFFYELSLEPCLLFDDEGNLYTLYKIRGKLHEIVEKYFKTSTYHLKYILNECLFQKGLIKYRFGKEYVKNNEEIGIKNFITDKGIKYLEEEYSFYPNKTLGELTEQEYNSTYGNIVPRISSTLSKLAEGPAGLSKHLEKQFKLLDNIQKYAGLNSTALKLAQQLENSPSLKAARDAAATYSHIVGNTSYLKDVAEIQNLVPSDMQKASNEFFQNQNFDSKDMNEENKESNLKNNKFYTFEGILGRNCGTINKYYGSEPRLQAKGYIVEDGIYVLRGYAKMSDLVGASVVDQNNYQRQEDFQHIKDIKAFLKNGKVRFLPEVILVARKEVQPEELDLSLKGTQLGAFKNINYRKITVAPKSLYRVDGNHRLNAYDEKGNDYYIPFSIILWHVNENKEETQQELKEQHEKNAIDNEAFLFYLLNAKSKPLTLEDNIKGIVKSNINVWRDENIREINFIFPHLRNIYNNLNNNSLFEKSHYLDDNNKENVWSQYLNILNEIFKRENKNKKIEDEYKISFDKEQCKDMVCNTLLLLNQTTRFKYLRENYKKLPQLIFYLQYLKFLDSKNEINTEDDLEDINNWAEKYKHDDNSFENPINMYENAIKQIQRGEINIFVAMPYYGTDDIRQFNLNYQNIISEIINRKPKLKNRLKLFPIMEHTGETKNILSYIDNCIDKCQIFIADVSNDPAKNNIVNPNVMYELGVARQKQKPCIIIRNAQDINELAFDIKPMSVYSVKFENPNVNFIPTMTEHIEDIIEKYYIS